MSSFRRALAELQAHVNDLDNLKVEHYSEVYEYEQEMWELIASKVEAISVLRILTDIALCADGQSNTNGNRRL